jgi:hypothetical protein
LDKFKVEVKQTFNSIHSIIFEAALTPNELKTKYKQKEYDSQPFIRDSISICHYYYAAWGANDPRCKSQQPHHNIHPEML